MTRSPPAASFPCRAPSPRIRAPVDLTPSDRRSKRFCLKRNRWILTIFDFNWCLGNILQNHHYLLYWSIAEVKHKRWFLGIRTSYEQKCCREYFNGGLHISSPSFQRQASGARRFAASRWRRMFAPFNVFPWLDTNHFPDQYICNHNHFGRFLPIRHIVQ